MLYIHLVLITLLVTLLAGVFLRTRKPAPVMSWKEKHSLRSWGQIQGNYPPTRYRLDPNPWDKAGDRILQLHRKDVGADVNDKSDWLSVGFISAGDEDRLVALNIFRRYREDHPLTETLQLLREGLAKGTISMVTTEKEVAR